MARALFTALCLVLGIAFTGNPAEAALAWKGFSELCFEGSWKGGSVTNGELTITVNNLTVQTRCDNIQNPGETCQPGGGNAGGFTITVDANADPTKGKGVISANGCIPLDGFDHHDLHDALSEQNDLHQHTCLPLTNTNKIERPGSAIVTKIEVEYVLKNGDNIIRRGVQTCFWPGSATIDGQVVPTFNDDPAVCAPITAADGVDEILFTCPIDQEFKK